MSEALDPVKAGELYDAVDAKLPSWVSADVRHQTVMAIVNGIAPLVESEPPPIGHNMPPDELDDETDEEKLRRIDPTKLVVLPVEKLEAYFAIQFPELVRRSEELCAVVNAWRDDHKHGLIPVRDDVENNALSDLMRQLRGFAGDDGECEAARKSVKLSVFQAGRAIDAFFNRLRDPINLAVGPAKHAGPGTMAFAQTAYLLEKLRVEREAREAAARAAEEAARLAAEEARRLTQEEVARVVALQQSGMDQEEAIQIAAEETDRAVSAADGAWAQSSLVGAAAAEPAKDLVRSRSAMGTTTTLSGTFELDEANIDVMALAKAVVAGKQPITFLTANISAIKLAIRAKTAPLRECPGLVIKEVFAARRRGG